MRTAVVTSALFDIYGAAIISRLISEGQRPVSVICVRPSRWEEIRGYVRRHGVRGTLEKVLQVLNLRPWPGSDHWGVMQRYAQKHGLTDWKTPLPQLCRRNGIELVRVKSLNDDATVRYVRQRQIDLLLNAGRALFRAQIIEAPAHGVLNVHKGILPVYRGYNVLEWSLLDGSQPGVTLHFVNAGLDTGDIVRSVPIPVEAGDDIKTLRAKSYPLQVDLMVWGLQQLVAGSLTRIGQVKEDGKQHFAMHPRLKTVAERSIGRHFVPDSSGQPAISGDEDVQRAAA
jgi:folate-dependent phosphoribosylglycinamide formyltransferase PurN